MSDVHEHDAEEAEVVEPAEEESSEESAEESSEDSEE